VDDETYRNARVKAAELDTSVSALVKRYLVELGAGETEFQRLERKERELRARAPRVSRRRPPDPRSAP
jgi:hypothetical protein